MDWVEQDKEAQEDLEEQDLEVQEDTLPLPKLLNMVIHKSYHIWGILAMIKCMSYK